MRARAPGKLVLSGAYSVLEGAPAIVVAVDRYAVVDSGRAADFVTDEVREAIERGYIDDAPWFDASALRLELADGSSRKLGLGSSAAIVVASLLACGIDEPLAVALECHREAQGGGSGIDVAASCLGGVLRCQLCDGELTAEPIALADVVIEVLATGRSMSTRAMLQSVRAFAATGSKRYRALMDRAHAWASAAVAATDGAALVEAIAEQAAVLGELGREAGVPIVTEDVAELDAVARESDSHIVPSGAGGGDVALFLGCRAPSDEVRRRAAELGMTWVPLALGARGAYVEGAGR